MPLTDVQMAIARLLSQHRAPDSYLAGGAALHLEPESQRYSADLDYFHDSVERVAEAFAQDCQLLEGNGYQVTRDMAQPGYIRAMVTDGKVTTKVEWAHDSAWRFLPPVRDDRVGFILHPVDLAINKLLALVGRDEARDFLDVMQVHENVLSLGALCWAAAGKDPGFTPLSLLELLRRRGHHRPEDFSRLHLAGPVNLVALKTRWLAALEQAEGFVRSRPTEQIGCLYYAPSLEAFVTPEAVSGDVVPHFGRPGGVLPAVSVVSE